MSYSWLSESEMDAARAQHEAGELLDDDGRVFQRRIDDALERDPEYREWADRQYLERWGVPWPQRGAETDEVVPEPDVEATS
jgi:hypothetical protein